MKRHACSTLREQQQRSWREMRISVFRVAKHWKRSKFASALNQSTDFWPKGLSVNTLGLCSRYSLKLKPLPKTEKLRRPERKRICAIIQSMALTFHYAAPGCCC